MQNQYVTIEELEDMFNRAFEKVKVAERRFINHQGPDIRRDIVDVFDELRHSIMIEIFTLKSSK